MQLPLNLKYQARPVRILLINNEPWWVNNDVCAILGHSNPRMAVASLDDDERRYVSIADAIGRERETLVINESGLYALIFGSRLPEARRFRKWVTSVLLPALRKDGTFTLTPEAQSLFPHLSRDFQKKQSKHTGALQAVLGGKRAAEEYTREVFIALSDRGWTPKRYEEHARAIGLPPELRTSGMQVLSKMEPHSAAAINQEQYLIIHGHEPTSARRVALSCKAAFRLMIEKGIRPGELDLDVN